MFYNSALNAAAAAEKQAISTYYAAVYRAARNLSDDAARNAHLTALAARPRGTRLVSPALAADDEATLRDVAYQALAYLGGALMDDAEALKRSWCASRDPAAFRMWMAYCRWARRCERECEALLDGAPLPDQLFNPLA